MADRKQQQHKQTGAGRSEAAAAQAEAAVRDSSSADGVREWQGVL